MEDIAAPLTPLRLGGYMAWLQHPWLQGNSCCVHQRTLSLVHHHIGGIELAYIAPTYAG